jgi:hypothetical protein
MSWLYLEEITIIYEIIASMEVSALVKRHGFPNTAGTNYIDFGKIIIYQYPLSHMKIEDCAV